MPDPNMPNDTTLDNPSFDVEEKGMDTNAIIEEFTDAVMEMMSWEEKVGNNMQNPIAFLGTFFALFKILRRLKQNDCTEEMIALLDGMRQSMGMVDYNAFKRVSSTMMCHVDAVEEGVVRARVMQRIYVMQQSSIEKKDALVLSVEEQKAALQKWRIMILKDLESVKIAMQKALQEIPYFVQESEEKDPRAAIIQIIGLCTSCKDSMRHLLQTFATYKKIYEEKMQYIPAAEKKEFQLFFNTVLSEVDASITQAQIENDLMDFTYHTKLHIVHNVIEWTAEKIGCVEDVRLVIDGGSFFQEIDIFLDKTKGFLAELEINPYHNPLKRTIREASYMVGRLLAELEKTIPRFQLQTLVLLREQCMLKIQLLHESATRIVTEIIQSEMISYALPSVERGITSSHTQKENEKNTRIQLQLEKPLTLSEEKRAKKMEALRAKLSEKKDTGGVQKNNEKAVEEKKKADACLADLLRDENHANKKKKKKKIKQPAIAEEEAEVSLRVHAPAPKPVVISAEQSARNNFLHNISTWMQEKQYEKMKLASQKMIEITEDSKVKFDYCCEYVNACIAELDHALQKALMACFPGKLKKVHQQMVQQNEMVRRLLDHHFGKKNIEPGAVGVLDDETLQEMERTARILDENIERITQSIKEKKNALDKKYAASNGLQKRSRWQEKIGEWETHLGGYLKELEQPGSSVAEVAVKKPVQKGGEKKAPPLKNKTRVLPSNNATQNKNIKKVAKVASQDKKEADVDAPPKKETPTLSMDDVSQNGMPLVHSNAVAQNEVPAKNTHDALQNETFLANLHEVPKNEVPTEEVCNALPSETPTAARRHDPQDEKRIEESSPSQFASAACFLPPPAPPFSFPMQKEHWLAALLPSAIKDFMMQVAQKEGVFMALSGGALLRARKGQWANIVDWDFSTNLSREEISNRIAASHRALFDMPWKSNYVASLSTAKFAHAPNKRADINSYTDLSLHIEKLKAHAQEHSDFTVNALYLIATAQGFCLFDAARGVVINTAEEFDAIPEIKNRVLRITKTDAEGKQDLPSIRKNPILILRVLKMRWTKGYKLNRDLKTWMRDNGKAVLEEVMQNPAHPEHAHFQHYIQKELKPLWIERHRLEVMYNQQHPQHGLYMQQEYQQHFDAFLRLEETHQPAYVVQQPGFLTYVENKFAPMWNERCRLLLNNRHYTNAQTLLAKLGLPEIQVLAAFADAKRPDFTAVAVNDAVPRSESGVGARF